MTATFLILDGPAETEEGPAEEEEAEKDEVGGVTICPRPWKADGLEYSELACDHDHELLESESSCSDERPPTSISPSGAGGDELTPRGVMGSRLSSSVWCSSVRTLIGLMMQRRRHG